MNQLFKGSDPRRKWNGFRSYFYPHEYHPIGTKPLNWIHIHFISQAGEIEVYLQNKNFKILTQWGKISQTKQNEIKKFVAENYNDIIKRVVEELNKLGIKLNISWQD
jgi:hypothetical protein